MRFRLLCGSAALATMVIALGLADVKAQTTSPGASEALPTVNVRGAKKRVAKKPQRPARATRVARHARPTAPPPAPPPQRESGTGPVGSFVASQSVTGTKTDTPILEVPQSISVVPREQVETQRTQGLQETLRYTPGASIEPNGSSSQFDYFTIRGFDAPQFRDGLRLPQEPGLGFARWRSEPYGLERIEVLRGPSAGIYGQSAPGGIINMVSKRPTDKPFYEVLFQTGSFDRLQGAFDLGGPIDPEGKFLYRLTGLGRLTDLEIDFNDEKRAFIAPAFTWRPNADTSITFLSQYQKDDVSGQPHQYIPAQGSLLPNPNGRISRSLNVGDPNTDRLRREEWSVGYALEHRFNDVWQFRQNLRFGGIDLALRSLRGEGLLPDLRTLVRSDFSVPSSAQNFTVDNQLQADFRTGPLEHKLLLGVDYYKLDSKQQILFAPADPIDIFAPNYTRNVLPLAPFTSTKAGREQTGFYAQDQIKLDRWLLTLTGRQDFATTTAADLLNNTSSEKNDSAFTGRAALGYLFDNGLAPYLTYATSFDPIAGVDKNGAMFRPTTGESVEAGIKYQPTWLPKTLFTLAAFEIKQNNVLTPDPDPAAAALGFQVQTGAVRVRGLELEARTSFTKGFNLIAAFAYMEPTIVASNNPAEIGKDMAQVPRTTASLWSDYTIQTGQFAGLGFGAGVRFIGDSYSDTINDPQLHIPSYTLFDAGIYYDFSYRFPELRGLKFDVVATNLADKVYVPVCYGLGYCNYGAGRRVLATLRYRWGDVPQRPIAALN
ncbi:MAG: TonB-dependent siderophore receptor [Rhizobiales bacterium]|nr:TonB-dependent siderophore receptor [Hyphomicrobiales bacterium]